MKTSSKNWLILGFVSGVLCTILALNILPSYAQETKPTETELIKSLQELMKDQTDFKQIGDFVIYNEADLTKKLDAVIKDQDSILKRLSGFMEISRFIKNAAGRH